MFDLAMELNVPRRLRRDDKWLCHVRNLISRNVDNEIADCTGRNPNVFYEIGIAHTLGRNVVMITEADVPFDLRHLR